MLEALELHVAFRGAQERVRSSHPAFEAFFRVYGRTNSGYRAPGPVEVLGTIPSSVHDEPVVAALAMSVGAGRLYVVPYQVASLFTAHDELAQSLVGVVRAHQDATASETPGYLSDLRLHGEQSLLDDIASRTLELSGLAEKARRFARYRLLVGPLQGDPLEELVIDTLNVLLERTDHRAENRPELFAEDFWICGPAGDVALAEVKGVNSGIKRPHINQVDDHRAALEATPEELPGLLIVNHHRALDLERKVEGDVHPTVRKHAQRQNVLVLRTVDLYRLLSLSLAGEPVGSQLVALLREGGGWLEVLEDGGRHLRVD